MVSLIRRKIRTEYMQCNCFINRPRIFSRKPSTIYLKLFTDRIDTRQTKQCRFILLNFSIVYIGRIIIFADFSDLQVFPQQYQLNFFASARESFRYSPFRLVLKQLLNHPAVLQISAQFPLRLSLSLFIVLKYMLLLCPLKLSP